MIVQEQDKYSGVYIKYKFQPVINSKHTPHQNFKLANHSKYNTTNHLNPIKLYLLDPLTLFKKHLILNKYATPTKSNK